MTVLILWVSGADIVIFFIVDLFIKKTGDLLLVWLVTKESFFRHWRSAGDFYLSGLPT